MYTRSKNETLFQNSKFSKEKEREREYSRLGKLRVQITRQSLSLSISKKGFLLFRSL